MKVWGVGRPAASTETELANGKESPMRRPIRVLLIAALAILVVALAAGCAATREAARSERPSIEVRVPAAEAADLRLRQEEAPRPPRPAPLSVSDESEGRWLTLFEVNVSPSEAAGFPSAPAGSP